MKPQDKPDIEVVSKTIEDKNLIESTIFLKSKNILKPSESKIKFETVKEAEDSMKEDIVGAINEKTNELKQEVSEMQKKGNDLILEKIKSLQIPLKLKVWLATTNKKDLEIILNIFSSIEKTLEPIKEKEEKKEKPEK
ncbi:hypothetical protein KAI32_04420 [Candidatus Pacearchaeota archaeon]|nr:hypothetical protein [Candidatus Pacearchaeota archaeon]